MFYAAGRVHPVLRTLLLPRELLKKRGSTVARAVLASVVAGGSGERHGRVFTVRSSSVDQLAATVRRSRTLPSLTGEASGR